MKKTTKVKIKRKIQKERGKPINFLKCKHTTLWITLKNTARQKRQKSVHDFVYLKNSKMIYSVKNQNVVS